MHAKTISGDIKDSKLAEEGFKRIQWAAREMSVLRLIHQRFEKDKPLNGLRIAGCLHVTTETANLALTLKAGGADVALCASNPLSTQDSAAAALSVIYNIPTFAINGEDNDTYYQHINSALDIKPHITLDDGADLVTTIHKTRSELIEQIIGGTEETTTGVIRLQSMAMHKKLLYPIIAVNNAETKHFFDNRYGTGQSTLDGITRATNILWAGKTVVVIGYGWCGKGVAMRAKGLGAHVTVTEVNPVRALEAIMDGFNVTNMSEAARKGDIFITVTGGMNAIGSVHFPAMKNGAIMANSGHFNVEIDIPALESQSLKKQTVRPFVEQFDMPDNKALFLLGEGRLINLAAAEGHPPSVMDMSFANQALSVEYLLSKKGMLSIDVHDVPTNIDQQVGKLKLASLGITIDTLSKEQHAYLNSWEIGT